MNAAIRPGFARRLEHTSDGSSKFWQVAVEGNEAKVTYGRIGSDGRESVKAFASPAEAKAFADKKIAEKMRGGYVVDDSFQASSAPAPSLGAAASAPVQGGVLNARLASATATAAPAAASATGEIDLAKHYSRAGEQLRKVTEGFEGLVDALETYAPKKPANNRLAFLFKLDPQTLVDVKAKQAEFQAFVDGPAAPLLQDPVSGTMSRGDLEGLHQTVAEFAKWAKSGIRLPSMMSNPHAVLALVETPLRGAVYELPRLDVITAPKLTAKEFAKLSASEQMNIASQAQARGYVVEDLGDDEADVKALIGDAGLKTIYAYIEDVVEQDVDNYGGDETPEVGEPSIMGLEAIKNGNEIIAYKVETHLNWQPDDIDRIGEHLILPDGTLTGEDHR